MSKTEKPLDKKVAAFVQFHLFDRHVFAPFTGTDFDAWRAFIHLVVLWGRSRSPNVVEALRAVVHTAQYRHQEVMAIFKKSIPCLLDWSHERELWLLIGPEVTTDIDRDLGMMIGANARRVLWPCPDGWRVCSHIHSKPDKKRPGWFKCKDVTCGETWRLDDEPAVH